MLLPDPPTENSELPCLASLERLAPNRPSRHGHKHQAIIGVHELGKIIVD